MNYIESICQNCQQPYQVLYKNRNRRKFCSSECSQKSREIKQIITCALCGKERQSKPSKLNAKSGIYFCSRACKNKAQSFKHNIIPSKLYNSKKRYIDKAHAVYPPICTSCGYKEHSKMLDVHHIDGNRQNNDISNLTILCVWCHALITRKNYPDDW